MCPVECLIELFHNGLAQLLRLFKHVALRLVGVAVKVLSGGDGLFIDCLQVFSDLLFFLGRLFEALHLFQLFLRFFNVCKPVQTELYKFVELIERGWQLNNHVGVQVELL